MSGIKKVEINIPSPLTGFFPIPIVLVTSGKYKVDDNIITVGWTGVLCSEPPLVYCSLRPSRHSYGLIKKYGCFGINIPSDNLIETLEKCGTISGRDCDKFRESGLTRFKASNIVAPLILECPVSLECNVVDIYKLGSHDAFIGSISNIWGEIGILDSDSKINFSKFRSVIINLNEYWSANLYKRDTYYGY